jgi:hypothetical protein
MAFLMILYSRLRIQALQRAPVCHSEDDNFDDTGKSRYFVERKSRETQLIHATLMEHPLVAFNEEEKWEYMQGDNLFDAIADNDKDMLHRLQKKDIEDASHFLQWLVAMKTDCFPHDLLPLNKGSMVTLAARYFSGRHGYWENWTKSFEWYALAYEQWKCPKSAYQLAIHYLGELGVTFSMERTIHYLEKAIAWKCNKIDTAKDILDNCNSIAKIKMRNLLLFKKLKTCLAVSTFP